MTGSDPETTSPSAEGEPAGSGPPVGSRAPRRRRTSENGYANGRERRQRIIATAMAVYGEVGYHSASLRDVARRVGMTHSGLLHYFATKEALLLAVLQQRDEEDEAAYLKRDGPLGAMRGLVDVVAANMGRPAIVQLYCVLSAEATAVDHPAHSFFRDRYRRMTGFAVESLREAEEAGALRPGVDPADAAQRVIALMDGLQVQFLYDRAGTDMVGRLTHELQDLLLVPLLEIDAPGT